jgi:hypothetical protein
LNQQFDDLQLQYGGTPFTRVNAQAVYSVRRVNALIGKGFRFRALDGESGRVQAGFKAGPLMSLPRIPASLRSPALPSGEARPVLRAKTIATRVTPEELAEVETAAESAGKTVAEWLRELALKAARERPADPTELLLAEVSALRYMLLNLFHATAQANAEGKHLLPDSVLKIRDQANLRKLADARKLLAEFLSQEGPDGGKQ